MTHHCKNRELTVAMAARYDLDAEHVAFVTGSGEDTNKVQSIVEDARRLREELAAEGTEGAFAETSEQDGDDTASETQADPDAAEDEATTTGEDDEATTGEDDRESEDAEQSGLSDFV